MKPTGSFVTFSFGATTKLIEMIFGSFDLINKRPSKRLSDYGMNSGDFTFFISEQIIIFLLIIITLMTLFLLSIALQKLKPK